MPPDSIHTIYTIYYIYMPDACIYCMSAGAGDWKFLELWDDGHNFLENEMIRSLSIRNLLGMTTMVRLSA